MSRDERIEAILAAWYELQESALSERASRRDERNKLLDEAIVGTSLSRQELLEALSERFKAYKLTRRKEDQAKAARKLLQP